MRTGYVCKRCKAPADNHCTITHPAQRDHESLSGMKSYMAVLCDDCVEYMRTNWPIGLFLVDGKLKST